jgi:hypothetical protein
VGLTTLAICIINWRFLAVFAVAVGGWAIALAALLSAVDHELVLGVDVPVLDFYTPNGFIVYVSGGASFIAAIYWLHNYGPFVPLRYYKIADDYEGRL